MVGSPMSLWPALAKMGEPLASLWGSRGFSREEAAELEAEPGGGGTALY